MLVKPFQIPSVVFCSTQRSGSTMMVDDFSILTGRVRFQTHENFCKMIDNGVFEKSDWPAVKDQLCSIINAERKGLFIENIMYDHAVIVSNKISVSEHDDVLTPFYHFFRNAVWVMVQRIDIFEQSISRYFAAKSNVWDKRYIKNENYNDSIPYNFNEIMYHCSWIYDSKKKWQIFFRAHNIEPIVIYYENAKDTYPDYLRPIFKKLHIEFPTKMPERRMKKLGNKRNQIFKEKVLDDLFDFLENSFDKKFYEI